MNITRTGQPHGRPMDAARSIAYPDSDANLRLAQRTRRSVGLALMGFLFLLVLLAPAIWSGVDDVLGDERVFDLHTEIAFLTAILLVAMLTALIAVWKRRHNVQHDRRGFETFPPIEK
jgi:hypothetical protein